MLKDNNDDVLRAKNIDSKVIPFYQIWQELVNPLTLDIYQYRVMTSLSTLIELVAVIEKTQRGLFTTDANIDACRSETLYILNDDDILSKYCKPLLNRLLSAIGKRPNSVSDKTRLLFQLKYAISIISYSYLDWAINELKDSIISEEIKKISKYSNVVVSQAISDGWSSYALQDMMRFFCQDKSFDEQWGEFKHQLLSKDCFSHDVLINIPFIQASGEAQIQILDTLQKLGLTLKTHEEIVSDYSDISDIGTLAKAEKRYFCVSVMAKDIYSAARAAIADISTALNLASFYNLLSAWDLKSVVIISINNISKYHKAFNAEKLYSTYNYLDSSGRIFESTRKIFADPNMQTIRNKLQGTFSYTNISRTSLFQEEKYMNLWVTLESLSRTNMYADIISNMRETIPAALCLRYIYRIVRNFVEDCSRCRIVFDFETKTIDMQQQSKQLLVKETIGIFIDGTLYTQLLEKCSCNSLLKYRCTEIREILLNIDCAYKKIENHHNRVNWQIQRLYRIRNEIAHAALQEKASLIIFTEHLNDYLSVYISEIVTCISEKKTNSFEEALNCIKDNYDVFVELYKTGDKELCSKCLYENGIISLI